MAFPISLMTNKHMENEKEILNMINQLDKQDFELSSDIKLLFDEIKNIEGKNDISKVESEINSIKENIDTISLQKGDKGDKGEKGKDGKNGKDGKDGRDGVDGLDGKDGENGKDGSPDTPEQIVEKINTLEQVIERKTIKGFESVIDKQELERALGILGQRTQYLINKTVVAPSATTWGSITGTQSDVNVGGFTNDVGYITSSALSGYTPTSRTITINGTTQDLSSNRSWTIAVPTKTSDLTNDSGFITSSALTGYLQNNVGIAGGTTLIGGTASGNNLTLSSTSHATKGKILFGTSAYDEVNNRLGIGTTSPGAKLEVRGGSDFWGLQVGNGTVGALFQVYGGNAGFVGFNGSAYNSLDIRCRVGTQLFLSTNGNVGIGTTSPGARVHLAAGTATASTAPLKFTAGTNLTTAEAGAIEYNNTFHVTNSDATRRHIVTAPNTTKVTASAPYTNDGYITINIGGTDFKVMTTA